MEHIISVSLFRHFFLKTGVKIVRRCFIWIAKPLDTHVLAVCVSRNTKRGIWKTKHRDTLSLAEKPLYDQTSSAIKKMTHLE